MNLLGIDPGFNTGIAEIVDRKLEKLYTLNPYDDFLSIQVACRLADVVIFEDSTILSHVFTTTTSRPAALKIARNIGEIDALCKFIKSYVSSINKPYYSISPKDKGKKVDAIEFERITGWNKRCNQHERDAAMVAWKYRNIINN